MAALNMVGGMKPIATNIADLSNIRETGLLFQTGLTIADCNAGLFTLRVLDEEVRQDFAALVGAAVKMAQ